MPVRANASLTSGSIPSRWPKRSADASGATDGSSPAKSRARVHDRTRPSQPRARIRLRPAFARCSADRRSSVAGEFPRLAETPDSRIHPGSSVPR